MNRTLSFDRIIKILAVLFLFHVVHATKALNNGQQSDNKLSYKVEKFTLDLSRRNLTKIDKHFLKYAESEVHNLILDGNEEFDMPYKDAVIEDGRFQSFQCVKCNITLIFMENFAKLPHLREVTIQDNPLKAIHPDAFKENAFLRRLDLRNNNLKAFNRLGTLKHIRSLMIINLSDNQFNMDVKYPLFYMGYMVKFDCENCNISRISPEALSGIQHLYGLNLRQNNLTKFNVIIPGLRSLDLSSNPLDLSGVSLNLPDLENFKCNNCSTNIIDDDLFSNCTDLLSVEMRHNGLVKITHDAFRGSQFLKRLMLENNSLKHIPGKIIKKDSLKELCFDNNEIEMSNENWNLMKFYFILGQGEQCKVQQRSEYSAMLMHKIPFEERILLVRRENFRNDTVTIRNTTFIFPHYFQTPHDNFTSLVMDGNRDFNFYHDIPFTFYEKLERFQCNGCGISRIYEENFRHTPKLKSVEIKNNQIAHFALAPFHNNLQLHNLVLDGNPMELLYGRASWHFDDMDIILPKRIARKIKTETEIETLPSLESFSCRDCNIFFLSEDAFEICPNLERIDLSGHNLGVFPATNLSSSLKELNLLGNLQEFPIHLISSSLELENLCIDYGLLNATGIALHEEEFEKILRKLEKLTCVQDSKVQVEVGEVKKQKIQEIRKHMEKEKMRKEKIAQEQLMMKTTTTAATQPITTTVNVTTIETPTTNNLAQDVDSVWANSNVSDHEALKAEGQMAFNSTSEEEKREKNDNLNIELSGITGSSNAAYKITSMNILIFIFCFIFTRLFTIYNLQSPVSQIVRSNM